MSDRVALVVGVGLLILWATHALAAEGYGRAGMPPTGECAPAYRGMDPDASQVQTYAFSVTLREPDRRVRYFWDYVFASRPCCQQTRNAVYDLASRITDKTALVVVGECR